MSNNQGLFRGAIRELREIKWPTRKRAVEVSTITLVFVAVSAVTLMLLDAGLNAVLYPGDPESLPPQLDTSNIQAVDADGNPIEINFEDGGISVTDTAPEGGSDDTTADNAPDEGSESEDETTTPEALPEIEVDPTPPSDAPDDTTDTSLSPDA